MPGTVPPESMATSRADMTSVRRVPQKKKGACPAFRESGALACGKERKAFLSGGNEHAALENASPDKRG